MIVLITFALLGLAILAVWVPAIPISGERRIEPWTVLFALATASALWHGLLLCQALPPIIALIASCALARASSTQLVRRSAMVAAAFLAVVLALHVVPGFNNPVVINAVHISEGSAPFTQYANFDKGAAGLILLAFFARRVSSLHEARQIVWPTAAAIALTSLVAILIALVAGEVAFDPKVPELALLFLAINLLFTCVAEEAFFRGVVQEQLMQAMPHRLHWLAIAVSSALFGLAHFAGGASMVVLATIGGLGYSLVYARTRRIESAILTHFGVNAVHFFGFTYPHLAG